MAVVLAGSAGFAQSVPFKVPSDSTRHDTNGDVGFGNGSFILAPIPFQNPAIDTGLALGGAYLFSNPGSSTSSVGLGGFRTTNGSQGYGLGFNLNFGKDRWKTSLLLGDVDVNYDLYVLGIPVPINQTGRGARAEVQYGVGHDLFMGVGLGYATTTIAPDFNGSLPDPIKLDADLEIASLSLLVNWDRRNDTYYPTAGTLVSGNLAHAVITSARNPSPNDRRYSKAVATASGYKKVLKNGVFAWQAAACQAGAEAPFFDSCSLGGTDNFRGYSPTEFIDNGLFSLQAEYRGILVGRFGYVAFAGAGAVGNDFGAAIGGSYHGAAGVGARFRLSKKFPLDYSVDVSYNDADEKLVYVYIGQRF
jgi:outer membrane protein assembly factor BamA